MGSQSRSPSRSRSHSVERGNDLQSPKKSPKRSRSRSASPVIKKIVTRESSASPPRSVSPAAGDKRPSSSQRKKILSWAQILPRKQIRFSRKEIS